MRSRSAWAWRVEVAVASVFFLALVLWPTGAEASAGQPSERAQASQQSAADWRYCKHRTSQPELGVFYPGQPVKVTIVAADTVGTSDLSLVDGLGNKVEDIQPDAKDFVNHTYPLKYLMNSAAASQAYTLSIYVRDNGQTFNSISGEAIATYGDGSHDRYICFEDGNPDQDFNDLVLHVQMEGDLTSLPPSSTNPVEVDVKYDDAAMLRVTKSLDANREIARGIEKRALNTLAEYKTLLDASGNGDAVPSRIEIDIEPRPMQWGTIPVDTAKTECTKLLFNSDYVLSNTEANSYVPNGGWLDPAPGKWLATTIDHEIWHTIQCVRMGLPSESWRLILGRDNSASEGAATAAQDTIADTDDLGLPDNGTFLWAAHELLGGNTTIDYSAPPWAQDGHTAYTAGALYEYLAEHYKTDPTLEKRVAHFLIDLSTGSEDHLTNVAYSMGKQWPDDVLQAFRDFEVGAYADNFPGSSVPDLFRIFDETTPYGQTPVNGALVPTQEWGGLRPAKTLLLQSGADIQLDPQVANSGALWELAVDPGTTVLHLRLTGGGSGLNPFASGGDYYIAAVPVDGSQHVTVDAARLFRKGRATDPLDLDIPVSGAAKVGLIIVSSTDYNDGILGHPLQLTLRTTQIQGAASLSMAPIAPVSAGVLPGWVQAQVQPAYGGARVTNLPASDFTADIDGSSVGLSPTTYDGGSSEQLYLQAPALSLGTHHLTVHFGTASAMQDLVVQTVASRAGVGSYMDVRPPSSQTAPLQPSASAVEGDYGLYVSLDATHAGSPFAARAALLYQGQGFPGATLHAVVTDPNGVVRHFALSDNGSWFDAGTGDGEYGASVLGTSTPGLYSVQVVASGTDSSGNPFSLSATASISLDAMVDSDGDGIADDMEVKLGLDPHNSSDASVDLDGDGLGTLQELAIGCDPQDPDTDRGGEPDGSEVARGNDPLIGGDDASLPTALIAATQKDGREFSVSVAAGDGATPVRLYRMSGGTSVDLGLQPGSGTTITDGPLPPGDYAYVAVVELANGAKSSPKRSPALPALNDATPPITSFALNGDSSTTTQRDIGITFYSTSEPLASMRFAATLDELASATWVPYEKYTQTTLAATPGIQSIYAQVKDASGLESGVIIRTIDYEPGAFEVERSWLSAQAVDTVQDGKYEAVRLAGQMAVRGGCLCRMSASLVAPDGSTISTAHQTIYLSQGTGQISLDFPGADIVASGKSGPYTVANLQIVSYDVVDSDASLLTWTTPGYLVSQFVAAPVSQVLQSPVYRYTDSVILATDSTEPYEIWGRFKPAGASSFGSWRQMGTGTPVLGATVAITPGDGTYEFYSLAISSATGAREAIPPMADISVVYDLTAPSSTLVGSVPSRVADGQLAIGVSSTDSMGINVTCVIHRFRATQDDSWSSWSKWYDQPTWDHCVEGSSGVVHPALPSPGFYEFMTQAMDLWGNLEPLKSAAQAETHYTTGSDPASHVMALPTYTNQTSFAVPYEADFASGGGTVDLYLRFEAKGATTFTDWAKIATTTYPNQLTAPLTQGDGRYELSTAAIDGQSSQSEARPVNADAFVNLDTVAPTTDWRDHPVTPGRGPSIQFAAEFSDEASAMAEARFYYRYKAPVGQEFGEWKTFADSADPSSVDCYWPSDLGLTAPVHCQGDATPVEGDGYYEVSAIGIDKAGNVGAREPAQLAFYLDTTLPTVNVTVPRATKYAYATITYTATDPVGMGSGDLYMQYTPPGESPGDWNRLYPVSSSPAYASLNQGPGTYSFFLDACDAAGNCLHDTGADFYVQASIILDTTAPTTSVASLPAHISSATQMISYTADDANGSGVQTLQIQRQFKGSGGYFGSWSTLSTIADPASSGTVGLTLADGYGTYHFRTIATDYAGNATTSATTTDTVLDAPIVATQAGPLAAAVKSTSLPVPYTVTSGTATSIQLYQRWTTPGGNPSGGYTQVASKNSPGTSGTLTVTLSKGAGLYEFYTVGVGSSGTESTPTSGDAFTVLDTTSPTSQASSLTTPRTTASATITFTANDNTNGSGLASVEIWQRWTAPGATPSGGYTLIAPSATSPYNVTLSAGDGRYEFYTLAVDAAGNREAVPSTPDAFTVLDSTGPVSSVSALAGGTKTTTFSVPFTANDVGGNGVASVELYERFQAAGSTTWSSYSIVATRATSPFGVTLGSGVGRYEFYTQAVDSLGNREVVPASADTFTVLDTTAPTSAAGPIPASVTSSALSVPYTASDETGGSGVSKVELYQRWTAPGGTPSGAYTKLSATPAGGSFSITLGSGSGTYQFYTIATDVATNAEAAPSVPDASTVYTAPDTTAPTSSITAPPSTSSAGSIASPTPLLTTPAARGSRASSSGIASRPATERPLAPGRPAVPARPPRAPSP